MSENNAKIRVGIEVCTSALRVVSIGIEGKPAMQTTIPFVTSGEALRQLMESIDGVLADLGEVGSIGIALPGLIDKGAGRVAFSAHFPEHSSVDLVAEIRERSGLPVSLENDANAAAWGEFVLGAGRGSDNFFYATLGEGVGGALVLGGEIWRGASGFAGEFGYVTINSEGMRLEEVASTENLVRRTRNRSNRDSTSSLSKIDEEAITLEAIIAAARENDDFAQMMLERTGVYVGTAIASVINLLNIEKIVIGGEIMEAKQLVLDAIIERARELSFTPSFETTTIVEGELGPYAAALGAALLLNHSG